MIALVPSEYILSADGALITAVIALAVGLARTRERLARLEEWLRLYERRHP